MRWTTAIFGLTGPLALLACDHPASEAAPAPPSASVVTTAAPPPSAPTPTASAESTPSASPSSRPRGPAPDTIVAQHILVTYKGAKRAPKTITRSKVEAKARAAEALAKLKAGAEFEDLVTAYSDDPGSIDRRGLVGKMHRADMPPAFSTAAFALQEDEVSDVVETQFGFHIIKRTQ